jgi:hypothetical protein
MACEPCSARLATISCATLQPLAMASASQLAIGEKVRDSAIASALRCAELRINSRIAPQVHTHPLRSRRLAAIGFRARSGLPGMGGKCAHKSESRTFRHNTGINDCYALRDKIRRRERGDARRPAPRFTSPRLRPAQRPKSRRARRGDQSLRPARNKSERFGQMRDFWPASLKNAMKTRFFRTQ